MSLVIIDVNNGLTHVTIYIIKALLSVQVIKVTSTLGPYLTIYKLGYCLLKVIDEVWGHDLQIDGLVQERRNTSMLAMVLHVLLSCTTPSKRVVEALLYN